MFRCLSAVFLLVVGLSQGEARERKVIKPVQTGLPNSQQPGPLVSFGQNIIGKKITQIYFTGSDYTGVQKRQLIAEPALLYGITDKFSFYIDEPIAASYQLNGARSSGPSDFYTQLEYAFYDHETAQFEDMATIVGNVTYPTGSVKKDPPTGAGAPSFFLGGTFSRSYTRWYAFGSSAILLPLTHSGTKAGDQYYYQGGIGRKLINTSKYIFAWLVEADGTYYTHSTFHHVLLPDSGGNIVFITPSFWFSTRNLIFQLGMGVPALQHWNGKQTPYNYLVIGSFGWSFY